MHVGITSFRLASTVRDNSRASNLVISGQRFGYEIHELRLPQLAVPLQVVLPAQILQLRHLQAGQLPTLSVTMVDVSGDTDAPLQ